MGDTITINVGEEDFSFPLRKRDDADKFSTGSRGFSSNGSRFHYEGKQYIVSCNIIEVGSKPPKEE